MHGCDAAILSELGRKILAQSSLPHPHMLKQSLLKLSQDSTTSLANLAKIDLEVARCFADVTNTLLQQLALKTESIHAGA
jgi:anhydro-N-acetylmuramic acid kinase